MIARFARWVLEEELLFLRKIALDWERQSRAQSRKIAQLKQELLDARSSIDYAQAVKELRELPGSYGGTD